MSRYKDDFIAIVNCFKMWGDVNAINTAKFINGVLSDIDQRLQALEKNNHSKDGE